MSFSTPTFSEKPKKVGEYDMHRMLERMYKLLDNEIWKYASREKKLVLPLFPEDALEQVIKKAGEIFKQQPTLLTIQSPVIIVGDLHGNLLDLLTILKNQGAPPWTKYLFLGDMVDRGQFSVETIIFIYLMQINFPDDVFIIRGNHEVKSMCKSFGFHEELMKKYNSENLFQTFIDTFDYTPFAALVDSSILCMHGGLGPKVQSLKSISTTKRPLRRISKKYASYDLLWSDPYEKATEYEKSPRGYGYLFGKKHVLEFEERNKIQIIVRGHEMATNGVNFNFDGRIVTVFSASNYCGLGNDAGVLQIDPGCHITAHTHPPFNNIIMADEAQYVKVSLKQRFRTKRAKKKSNESPKKSKPISSSSSSEDDDVLSHYKPHDEFTFIVPNQFVLCKHATDKEKKLAKFLQKSKMKEMKGVEKKEHDFIEKSSLINGMKRTHSYSKSLNGDTVIRRKKKSNPSSFISDVNSPQSFISPMNPHFPDSAADLASMRQMNQYHTPQTKRGSKNAKRKEIPSPPKIPKPQVSNSPKEQEERIPLDDNDILDIKGSTEQFSSKKSNRRSESVRNRKVVKPKRRMSPTPVITNDITTKFIAAQTNQHISKSNFHPYSESSSYAPSIKSVEETNKENNDQTPNQQKTTPVRRGKKVKHSDKDEPNIINDQTPEKKTKKKKAKTQNKDIPQDDQHIDKHINEELNQVPIVNVPKDETVQLHEHNETESENDIFIDDSTYTTPSSEKEKKEIEKLFPMMVKNQSSDESSAESNNIMLEQ